MSIIHGIINLMSWLVLILYDTILLCSRFSLLCLVHFPKESNKYRGINKHFPYRSSRGRNSMNIIDGIVRRVKEPSILFRYGSPKTREKYQKISRILRSDVFKQRRLIGEKILLSGNNLAIQETKGFKLEEPFALPETRKAVDNARELFSQANLDQIKLEAKKDYLLEIPIQSALTFNSPIIKLALEPSIIKAASHYMGMLPLLTQVQLWHSPNENVIEGGSQFFHLDYADVRQVKIFVFIDFTIVFD